MRNTSKHFLPGLFAFWIMIFLAARSFFLLALTLNYPQQEMHGWLYTYLYGIKLDLATAGYLTALPALIYIAGLFTNTTSLFRLAHTIIKAELLLVLLIVFGNIAIYKAWGTMLNARAISFLQDPEGIWASLSSTQVILILVILTTSGYFLIRVYNKFLHYNTPETGKSERIRSIILLVLLPIAMRGGLAEIPVNESSASFSEEMALNHAATNPAWYLINNLSKTGLEKENPFVWNNSTEQRKLIQQLQEQSSEHIKLFTNNRPNIVLIVLESWSADLIKPLGGYDTITPFFNQLCDSGYLFTNIYSSGRRTDQMFPSILSGFPSQPNHSLSRFSDKIRHLPMLGKTLHSAGYNTSFVYGGELGFANMKTYLLEAGIRQITGKEQFNSEEMNSKWGAHDEYIFNKALQLSGKEQSPFFQMILTLSTHEPFEVPGRSTKGLNENQKFLQAASYTDECLRNYFKEAQKHSWYNNTIFILVADHGHAVPKLRNYYDPLCYHIPLLITGPALSKAYSGKQNATFGGQHEIANTLLQQLNISDKNYNFGRSLTTKAPNRLAYLNYDDGFGIITENQQYVYLFTEKNELKEFTVLSPGNDSLFVPRGRAYLQELYQRFLSL